MAETIFLNRLFFIDWLTLSYILEGLLRFKSISGAGLALDPLIGAIGAGNAAVLKLSEIVPSVSSLLAKLIPMYMDTNAIKVVEGSISESEDLLEQRWDKIFYTGTWDCM